MLQKSNIQTQSFGLESTRIRSVYAQRGGESRYSHHDPGHLFSLQSLEREILSLLKAQGISLKDQDILEVGCGSGYWLQKFIEWGAWPNSIAGIDLLPDRIGCAQVKCPAAVTLKVGNAAMMHFPDASFDLAYQFVAFSSVLCGKTKQAMANEMLRVLKPSGHLLWYDFFVNNPKNQDVQGIGVSELVRLFPNCQFDIKKVTLAPPLTRKLAQRSWLACYLLEKLKVCNTHYLAVIRKNVSL